MDCSLLVGLRKEWLVVGISVTSCPHCGVGHTGSTFVIYCHQSIIHCTTLKMHMINITSVFVDPDFSLTMDIFNYGRAFLF